MDVFVDSETLGRCIGDISRICAKIRENNEMLHEALNRSDASLSGHRQDTNRDRILLACRRMESCAVNLDSLNEGLRSLCDCLKEYGRLGYDGRPRFERIKDKMPCPLRFLHISAPQTL